MSSRRRNKWLEPADSDGEDQSGYDSDGSGGWEALKGKKRPRSSGVSGILELESEDENENIKRTRDNGEVSQDEGRHELDCTRAHERPKLKQRQIEPPGLDPYNLSRRKESRTSKTGVIYLSRVPPFMKPQAVRNLLEPYGDIGRIFLTPEDSASHAARVRSGGNKKRSFTDGWVEFRHKKDAKIVAETLNARMIGGKKNGWYHDDIWNIKYLKGFKWHHLTEQIANENAERAARLRAEISQTTKENKRFIANVEHGKMLDAMQAKQKHRTDASSDRQADPKLHPKLLDDRTNELPTPNNIFQQKSSKRIGQDGGQNSEVLEVLRQIF